MTNVLGGIFLAAFLYSMFMILVTAPKDKRSVDQIIKDYQTNH